MNHRIIIGFLALLAVLTACSPKVPETTRIIGREGGMAERASVYVMDYDINERIELTDNTFTYELATNPAIVATFTCRIDGKDVNLPVIPDGSELTLTFRPDGAEIHPSRRHSVNLEFQRAKQVDVERVRLVRELMRVEAIPDTPKATVDSILDVYKQTEDKLLQLYREHLDEQKDNYLAVQALTYLYGVKAITFAQTDSLINTLDSACIRSSRIQMIQKFIKGRLQTQEGMPFVDFTINTEAGTVRLSDYVGHGKYVLADFWAGWCQPCIVEFPNFKALHEKYNGPDFTILGIACEERPDDTRAAIREHGIPWPQILGTGSIAMDTYGINGIPHIILFGPDGAILRRDIRGAQIGLVLEEYLAVAD